MAQRSEVLDSLDHPVVFTFLMALAVCAWCAVLSWGLKAAGSPGGAAFFQHP